MFPSSNRNLSRRVPKARTSPSCILSFITSCIPSIVCSSCCEHLFLDLSIFGGEKTTQSSTPTPSASPSTSSPPPFKFTQKRSSTPLLSCCNCPLIFSIDKIDDLSGAHSLEEALKISQDEGKDLGRTFLIGIQFTWFGPHLFESLLSSSRPLFPSQLQSFPSLFSLFLLTLLSRALV